MDYNTLLTIATGAAGAVIALLVEHLYLHFKEKRKESDNSLIKPKHIARKIDQNAIDSLTPGSTIELMKELLGAPFRYSKTDHSVFQEKDVKTHSYIYNLKNALIKITSKDNKTIQSLTVLAFDDDIYHESLEFLSEEEDRSTKLGKTKINENLIEKCRNHTLIRARKDYAFAVSTEVGNPYYMTFTYFGFPDGETSYEETEKPESLIGSTVDGFCISNNSNDVFYIYDYELR